MGTAHRALPVALLVVMLAVQPYARAEIIIVDSHKSDESIGLAQAISRHCTRCGQIQYMDMKRSPQIGREIIAELKAREANKQLDLVITLGRQATTVVTGDLKKTPIFHTLHPQALPLSGSSRHVQEFAITPSLAMQLDAFKALAPQMKRVGFLARRSTIEPFRDEIIASATANSLSVNFYYVDHLDDISPGLRQAIRETDGLLFLRDSLVINSDTIQFILRLTLENRVPTFAYSPALVDMGMTATLSLSTENLAQKIAAAVDAVLTDTPPSLDAHPESSFVLEVNERSFKGALGAVRERIPGMRVVFR
ncbi:ABC transporter substrate binding protein [Kordiimonas aestuarii]|uniref:ABC transporter substrate binding protein n=1 Tax=Kordiimonas aestuarii TaxID=1005925 RepID=UPI0021CF46B4|nr:ABC transporter substrate binding protein [Kordiimonas aestuarii]